MCLFVLRSGKTKSKKPPVIVFSNKLGSGDYHRDYFKIIITRKEIDPHFWAFS